MLTLTDEARTQILDFFKGNDIKPIRIFLNSGCGGQQLALAVDEQQPQDTIHKFDELTFLVEPSLMEKARTFTIDFKNEGFTIDSELELAPASCSACASSGSCGN
jgi:Fe-S cluster assembly iron-binding protein IscA